MHAPVDRGVHSAESLDRSGLQLSDQPAPQGLDPRARPLSWFGWGMLAAFTVLQLGYLYGLAVFVRWLLDQIVVM